MNHISAKLEMATQYCAPENKIDAGGSGFLEYDGQAPPSFGWLDTALHSHPAGTTHGPIPLKLKTFGQLGSVLGCCRFGLSWAARKWNAIQGGQHLGSLQGSDLNSRRCWRLSNKLHLLFCRGACLRPSIYLGRHKAAPTYSISRCTIAAISVENRHIRPPRSNRG